MPDGWEVRRLEEVIASGGLAYGIVQPGQDDPGGVPMLRVTDIRGGRVREDSVIRVSPDVDSEYGRTRLSGGEVLLSIVGSVGRVALVSRTLAGWNVARAIAVIRPQDVSSAWIRLCLTSELAQHCMEMWQTNTVQATLNLRDVRRLPIILPPRRDRDAIVEVIEVLDSKISVNEELALMCDTLRTLSLREFFLTREAAEYAVRPLSSVAEFVNGRAFTKDARGVGRMVVRIAEINSGPSSSTIYNDINVPDRHLVRPGEILFSWSGTLRVARWYRSEAIINQHIFKVVPCVGIPVWLAFELTLMKLADFQSIAADKATTMGHIQRKHLDEPVLVPSGDEIPALDRRLRPLWERALVAEQEALTLAELRDALLPKLMSGEVRVRDAEKIVEDVT
ncbi:restriction endonuclease subunit S [Frankia sp. ACN1ag]|uniref:restriction endonuclease subunit S n=1 Tax=Frankia sp. ACN1ag TaxID=102891 RepID=UPI001F02ADF6|nr:restriction endonuclease subunit S [Frankia sp. ACN1ag]